MIARTYETLQASASRTGLSVQTLKAHLRAGSLTGYRTGRRILRVVTDEVDALLASATT